MEQSRWKAVGMIKTALLTGVPDELEQDAKVSKLGKVQYGQVETSKTRVKFKTARLNVNPTQAHWRGCGTDQMVADALTKPLSQGRHETLHDVMGMPQLRTTSEGVLKVGISGS